MKVKSTIKCKRTVIYSSFVLILILILSSNLYAKKQLTYIELVPTINSNSSLNICIATYDQREVVLQGNQNAKFVGYIRSATAIAYPIFNSSEGNFSDVVSETINKAFKKNGSNSSVIKTNYTESKDEVLKKLTSNEADVFILITLNKWRTDTKPMSFSKVATELIYDLKIEIYNKSGELLASSTLVNKETGLAAAGSSSIKKIQAKVINIKYPEVMTNLFTNQDIENALK